MKKSQVGLEFLAVVAIGLAVLVPVFFFIFSYYSDTIKTSQASEAVDTLAKSVEHVYSLGVGSQITVQVLIPEGVNKQRTNATGNTIRLSIYLSGGKSDDIVSTTKPKVLGYLPTISGIQSIPVKALRNGYVQINKILVANVTDISATYIGSVISRGVNLKNMADFKVNNINILKEGETATFTTVNPDSFTEIDSQSSKDFSISINPSGKPSGIYEGLIFINSTNGGEAQIYLNITVP